MTKHLKDFQKNKLVNRLIPINNELSNSIGSLIGYQDFDFEKFFLGNEKEEIEPQFKLGQHILVLGTTGTGKTNFLINFFAHCPHKIIFFNSIGIIEVKKLSDISLTDETNLRNCLINPKIKKISITPKDEIITSPNALMNLWDRVCKEIYMYEDLIYTKAMEKKGWKKDEDFNRRADIIIVCDELMFVMEDEDMTAWHMGLLTRGRNYKISHVGASQRNQNISKKITNNTFHIFILRMNQYDINALQGKIKYIEYSDKIKPFHFVYYTALDNIPSFYKPVPLLMYQ